MTTIEQQIEAMKMQWPRFKLTERTHDRATWEGHLSPDKRAHTVRIAFRLPHLLENITLKDAQPRVQVIAPLLERHPDYEQGPLPHVYVCKSTPEMPYLCLFSPSQREWSFDDLIAETTVFWAWEWLYFYEGWLVTKKWKGGGQHPPAAGENGKFIEKV